MEKLPPVPPFISETYRSLARFVLELFKAQPTALYFEMYSSFDDHSLFITLPRHSQHKVIEFKLALMSIPSYNREEKLLIIGENLL